MPAKVVPIDRSCFEGGIFDILPSTKKHLGEIAGKVYNSCEDAKKIIENSPLVAYFGNGIARIEAKKRGEVVEIREVIYTPSFENPTLIEIKHIANVEPVL